MAIPAAPNRICEDIFGCTSWNWIGTSALSFTSRKMRAEFRASRRKIGIFLLHGGVSDFKSVEGVGKLLPEKFGIKWQA